MEKRLQIEATDRYEALGITPNGCKGECEGTGVVPIYMQEGDKRRGKNVARVADEDDPRFVELWRHAEDERPTRDGWHFVSCPTCS